VADAFKYETHAASGWHPIYRRTDDMPPMGGYKVAQFKTGRVAEEICEELNSAVARGRVQGIEEVLNRLEEMRAAGYSEQFADDLRRQFLPEEAAKGGPLR